MISNEDSIVQVSAALAVQRDLELAGTAQAAAQAVTCSPLSLIICIN